MDHRSRIDDLSFAVEIGHGVVQRHRLRLATLVEIEAPEDAVALAKLSLEAAEEIHAENLAELSYLAAD